MRTTHNTIKVIFCFRLMASLLMAYDTIVNIPTSKPVYPIMVVIVAALLAPNEVVIKTIKEPPISNVNTKLK